MHFLSEIQKMQSPLVDDFPHGGSKSKQFEGNTKESYNDSQNNSEDKKDSRKMNALSKSTGNKNGQKSEDQKENNSEAMLECPKGCGIFVKSTMARTHNCIYELRQVIDEQSCAIQELRNSLKKLRKNFRAEVKRSRERDAQWRTAIDGKITSLSNDLHDISLKNARRCYGRCRKHIKTDKCLCQGFSTVPHACCGKEGGICDC